MTSDNSYIYNKLMNNYSNGFDALITVESIYKKMEDTDHKRQTSGAYKAEVYADGDRFFADICEGPEIIRVHLSYDFESLPENIGAASCLADSINRNMDMGSSRVVLSVNSRGVVSADTVWDKNSGSEGFAVKAVGVPALLLAAFYNDFFRYHAERDADCNIYLKETVLDLASKSDPCDEVMGLVDIFGLREELQILNSAKLPLVRDEWPDETDSEEDETDYL